MYKISIFLDSDFGFFFFLQSFVFFLSQETF